MKTSPSTLLFLSGLGLWGLWGVAYFNGMLDRLDSVMESRKLPDGRQVRDRYSGIPWLDEQLTLLAVFYGMLTDGLSSGPRLLFFDILAAVSCTNLWVLLESRRAGQRNWLLKYPVWIMIACNANGAAIFQPPFFYALVKSRARLRDPTVQLADAVAVFAMTLPIMLSPLLLFVPAWTKMSHWQHQGYIAVFHASPVLLALLLVGIAAILRSAMSPRRLGSRGCAEPQGWIVASLVCAGILAAAVHIYTWVGALIATDPDATLSRVFFPTHGRANPFPAWIKTLPSPTAGVPGEYAALLENFHLFSQYDWFVVSVSCCLFSHFLLCGRVGRGDKEADQPAESVDDWWDLVYLAAATIVLGPGAAGSFALAIGESRVQHRFRASATVHRDQERAAKDK